MCSSIYLKGLWQFNKCHRVVFQGELFSMTHKILAECC